MRVMLSLLLVLCSTNAFAAGQWTSTQQALGTPATSSDYIMAYERDPADPAGQRAVYFNGNSGTFLDGTGSFSTIVQLPTCTVIDEVPTWDGTQWTCAVPDPGGVTSFNTRTGAITPQESDYSSFFLALASCTTTGEIPIWNQTTTSWACGSQTGGTTNFIGLTDTPSAYTADYWVKVNAAGTGLEFVTAPTGTGDVSGPATATDNGIAVFSGTTGKIIADSTVTIDPTTGDFSTTGDVAADSFSSTATDGNWWFGGGGNNTVDPSSNLAAGDYGFTWYGGNIYRVDDGNITALLGTGSNQASAGNHTHTTYLESVVAGSNITVDNSDPQNPVITATGTSGGSDVFDKCFDLSDETTPLTAGTSVYSFRMQRGMTIEDVRASLNTGPEGSDVIIDINENGSSIFSTPLTFDYSTYATGTSTISGTSGSVDSIAVDGVTITNASVIYNTANDVASTGNVWFAGTSGSVDDITVNSVSVMSSAVSYNTDNDVAATGTFELTAGSDGEITLVLVGSVEVTSAAVPFNTDLTTTAADLAANITAYTSIPNYTATSSLGVVTITAADTGTSANGLVISGASTLTLTYTTTDMSGGVSDIAPTAADVAANITAFTSTPNYTATSDASGVITITADAAGAGTNGYAISASSTTLTSGYDSAMSGGVSDISLTATDVASNITSYTSTPNYTATSSGGTITIAAVTSGPSPNGYVVTTTTTELTSVDEAMSGGADSATTTTASAIPYVLSDNFLADDSLITVDIDQVGSTTAGTGAKVCLVGNTTIPSYTLTVTDPGNSDAIQWDTSGADPIDCGNGAVDCTTIQPDGTVISGITAVPASGREWTAWTGDITGVDQNSGTVTFAGADVSGGATFGIIGAVTKTEWDAASDVLQKPSGVNVSRVGTGAYISTGCFSGDCYSNPGIGSYATIPITANDTLDITDFEIELYFKYTDVLANYQYVLYLGADATNKLSVHNYADGSLYARVQLGGTDYSAYILAAGSIVQGTWYKLNLRYTSGVSYEVDIDGINRVSISTPVAIVGTAANLELCSENTNGFAVDIDEVTIW